MKYHGAQPSQGIEPGELYAGVERVAMAVLETFFLTEPAKNDHRWIRLGALQLHLERGMSASRRTVEFALEDCRHLLREDYGKEWKKVDAFSFALAEFRKAIDMLLERSDGSECNTMVDLGRDKLIPDMIGQQIENLRTAPK